MSFWERLSALDASFLGVETDTVPMHVGALITLDAGPLATADGGIDFPTLARYFRASLGKMPRYRQRLAWVPGLRHPVWVDDEHFNLYYHLRHTALPRPGDERGLKRLAGRVFSQRLDRTRPLWEVWVVEGLTDNRFALICKIHHCMVDGIAGVELMGGLLRGTDDATVPEPEPWEPRPAPSATELLAAELEHRALGSRNVIERLRNAVRDPGGWWHEARDTAEGLASSLRTGLAPASPTPLNPKRVGPYRRFDVLTQDIAQVKQVKNRLGGKLNDVVLATATGAIARFLERRGVEVGAIEDFRAMVPVNIRRNGHGGTGNRVAMMLAPLPLSERDPATRLAAIHQTTEYLKTQSHQVESAELIEELANMTATSLVKQVFSLASRNRAYNVVITNVPGPPFPLYLLGARILEAYPLVPLFGRNSLGIALLSYAGKLHWGLCGEWQTMPDLHHLTDDLQRAFDELVTASASPESEANEADDARSPHHP